MATSRAPMADLFPLLPCLAPLELRGSRDFPWRSRNVSPGTPYLHNGAERTHAGCDCSGLIQTALEAAGIAAPRDTDMMEQALGSAIEQRELRRGDLIFWKGHMGVMRDAEILLHANAFHMETASEPLADAIARIEKVAGPVTSVKKRF